MATSAALKSARVLSSAKAAIVTKFDREYSKVDGGISHLNQTFAASGNWFVFVKHIVPQLLGEKPPHKTDLTINRQAMGTFWRSFLTELCVPEEGDSAEIPFKELLPLLDGVWVHRAISYVTASKFDTVNYFVRGLDSQNKAAGKQADWFSNSGKYKHVVAALDGFCAMREVAQPQAYSDWIEDTIAPLIRSEVELTKATQSQFEPVTHPTECPGCTADITPCV